MAKIFPPNPTQGGNTVAKKRRGNVGVSPAMFRPPSPQERRQHAADHFAEVMVETDPQILAKKDRIKAAALKAAGDVKKKGK